MGDVDWITITHAFQFVPGERWCIRVSTVIGFHQHRTIGTNLIIQPDKRLLVAIVGDVKTTINPAPGSI
ncbi:hypothetical protein ENINMMO181B_06210 [Enterobacter intestinihominis]|nr:Uncharacterised protein [Enterobacter hormaechei]